MTTAAAASCLCLSLLPSAGFAAESASAPPVVVQNAGFEEPVTGTDIPGWNQVFGKGESNVFYQVTSAEKYEGNQSLLLDDRNSAKALGLETTPFTVVPGTGYSASAMMKVESGSMAIYFRFFNAAGAKIGESANWVTPTSGQWVKNATSSVVPADAVSATVLLYSSAAGVTRGYADAVRVEENKIGTFERIGGIVNGMINEDAAVGVEDGKAVVYTVFKGRAEVPTSFFVIDALTRDVLRSFPMPGVEAAWGVKVATDGRVYIGSHYDGGLYRYTPGVRSFEHLGRFGSETHVFSLVAGPGGKMFAGTYPGGKLFEFDPAIGEIRDLGVLDPEQNYVRSLAYDAQRDVLYAGVGGSKSRIFKINPDGTRKELLGSRIPGGGDTYAWPYSMGFAEDRLFVKFSNGDLLVLRPDDTIDYYDPNGMDIHSGQVASIPGQPGRVLFANSGHLYAYDSATRSTTLLKQIKSGVNFQDGQFVDLNSAEWPGLTFVGMGQYGKMLYYNLSTDRTSVVPAIYSGAPILIQSIHTGPDKKMYVAGYMSGFTSYDPVNGAVSDTNSLGQIESSAIRNGKMLLGAYAGARILEYDPKLPFSGSNPRQLFDLRAHSQDRPFAMAYAEDRDQLFVGTVPNSTSLQGALAMYDFATGQLDVFRNIIPNQSIVSLIYKDGLIYAGTTVYGGLGTGGPTETNAKLFIFDPVTKTKVFETIPVTGRKGITGLSVGPDGLIWGVAEDTIFKFDPSSRQFVYKAAKLRRYKADGTTWTYAFLHPGDDGNMYGTSRGQFFMIKPETSEFVLLNGSYGNYLNRDAYGNFYFSDNSSDLWKYTPPGSATDMNPPVTTAVYGSNPNATGWFNQNVDIILSSADDDAVKEMTYRLEGAMQTEPVKVNGDRASVQVNRDGVTVVRYAAIDRSGNQEPEKELTVRLDRTKPTITVTGAGAYTIDQHVTVGCTAADSVSGVVYSSCSSALVNADAYTIGDGPHTLNVRAEDAAGNVEEVAISYEINVTYDSLIRLSERLLDAGPGSQGHATALQAHLRNAEKAGLEGKEMVKQASIHAYIQQVEALGRTGNIRNPNLLTQFAERL